MTEKTETAEPTHLWEFDHPYYSSDSNYFSNGYHSKYESWESFFEAEGDSDKDMNHVFRWDWEANDLDDDTRAGRREYAARFGDRDHAWTLNLFYVLQRKGIYRVVTVKVCKANEPAVRVWLTTRAEHVRQLWEPLLPAGVRLSDGEDTSRG